MSERITIEGEEARLTNGDGTQCVANVNRWMQCVQRSSVQGMSAEPLPDNVKWVVTCGALKVCIVELKPEVGGARRYRRGCADSAAVFEPPGNSPCTLRPCCP